MTDQKHLSEHSTAIATETWLAVVRSYNQCTMTLAQRLDPLGITLLQHEILMNLLRTPGLTQQHLSERCFSAKSGVSMLVARFMKDGMIERKRAPKDHRAWNLFLTSQGLELAWQAEIRQRDVVMEMARNTSEEELEMVKRLMDQSSERLKEMRERD